jgi:hypothetical protein
MRHLFTSGLLILSMAVTPATADKTPPFKITTKRDNDNVVVKTEKDRVVISVQSPFGISQAVIEPTEAKWPDTVVLRLHLKGLENFQVTNDKMKLEASVSSQDSKVRLWKNGKEKSQIDAKSPYWMDVQMIGSDRKPAKAVPLKDGYFQIDLPKVLFEDNPKSITVHWIDFYR